MWKKVNIKHDLFYKSCLNFYKVKTFERLKKFHQKYNDQEITNINGQFVDKSVNLLEMVDWEELCKGEAVFFHGDLQFDNILYSEKGKKFCLIDWRQDFDGHIEFGDIYYDLAKMYGGILLNYDYVKKNLINYFEEENKIELDFAQKFSNEKVY